MNSLRLQLLRLRWETSRPGCYLHLGSSVYIQRQSRKILNRKHCMCIHSFNDSFNQSVTSSILVSKLQQMTTNEWFKIIHVYSFTILVVRSLKSRCWKGCPSSGKLQGRSRFLTFFIFQRSIAFLGVGPFSIFKAHPLIAGFVVTFPFFSLSLHILPPFYKDHNDYIGGPPR